ncbi:MAG: hypothetical protein FJ115_01450 [Deltaproteobacteria bacterium]|nr:hypothetical protein [Deltaproteobacteria bacterium]MBM4322199.1 hypothetical protein [Deltaproteobacteria bacterium]MBM4346860.1 hypothetical protein [Deltaproteobacteria bacterium]
MNSSLRWIFLVLLLLSFPAACLPSKKLTVGSAATLLEEVAKSAYKQSDLRVIREGMPAYLMLMDGMIEAWPGNERLLLAAAQGYSSFASIFTEDDDYARELYRRAKDYALRSLEKRGFKDPINKPFDDFKEELKRFGKKEVPNLFWTATCWGSWISFNLDSMEAMAALPRVEQMIQRVLELDEGFYYGGSHLFMGVWHASRPKALGGDLKKSREHFFKALDLGKGKFLMAYIYYAEHYARKAQDRDLFTSTLGKVLETPVDVLPELTLLNAVAQKRAKELLRRVEEFFE